MIGPDAIEIGFTGGEPFMNPDILTMTADALERGHRVLILTNAMQPMMRSGIKRELLDLKARYGERITLRVSLDHHTQALHDAERGAGAFAKTMGHLRWLADEGFSIAVAGRAVPGEAEADARAGYATLFLCDGIRLDTDDRAALVIFPEMDERADVPEITTSCWDILHVNPADMMCATSRMVVKRKGAARPVFVACTLLPDDPQFEMGETLAESLEAGKAQPPALRQILRSRRRLLFVRLAKAQIAAVEIGDAATAHQLHVALDLLAHQAERALDAGPACRRQRIEIEPPARTCLGAERERFKHMGAALNAALADHVDLVAHRIDDLGKLVERAARTVELASAMVRYHDAGAADIHGAFGIGDAHHAFQREMPAPFGTDRLGILPAHRLVQHGGEIAADRSGKIGALLHVLLEVRQFHFRMDQIVDRPARPRAAKLNRLLKVSRGGDVNPV